MVRCIICTHGICKRIPNQGILTLALLTLMLAVFMCASLIPHCLLSIIIIMRHKALISACLCAQQIGPALAPVDHLSILIFCTLLSVD